MEKKRDYFLILLVTIVFGLLCVFAWVKPADAYSYSERRKLKQLPEISTDSLLSGRFMSAFEDYSLDQFPFRETFRSLKAVTSLKADNNGIYAAEGGLNALEYPLDEEKLDYASKRFANVYDTYLRDAGCNVYLSIIPDKNYFYAAANGYPAMDYGKLVSIMGEKNGYMKYVDIFPFLTGEDYYRTDTHWRQECLAEVAAQLLGGMGKETDAVYETVERPEDFYGVYYGQAALPVAPDRISYLTNSVIGGYAVSDLQNGLEIPVYDIERMTEADPYEMFLGGPLSLVTIENPACEDGSHLILFRDSFASSLAPLLAQEYRKTTLVDIRYVMPAMLDGLVDFEGADVLFLYSTMVLNNSETLK